MHIQFPEKLEFLFYPRRYKIAWGGRGGAKSWGFARALLLIGAGKIDTMPFKPPVRILCCREIQNSIADSVHKLLRDQIYAMGLEGDYDIQKNYIYGPGGTEFSFEGLKLNVSKIKSKEGTDICWVEEAQVVSRASWATLIPTIRKPQSEIWVSFNPELETDDTYQRFVLNPPPPDMCAAVNINWRDNSWFPSVLAQEKDYLEKTDYDEYLHVWEGKCRTVLAGAVYAKEIRAAIAEGRITKVPYERGTPVDTFWDLGRADSTSIWFGQRTRFQYRVIDFFEDNQEHIDYYLRELQKRPYVYGTAWLPHDAKKSDLGTKRTVYEQVRDAGYHVRLVPKLTIGDGINAARTIFPNCWFDEDKCSEGLHALKHYRYEVTKDGLSLAQAPMHDWASHAADAFRYMGVALKEPGRGEPKLKMTKTVREFVSSALSGTSWLE